MWHRRPAYGILIRFLFVAAVLFCLASLPAAADDSNAVWLTIGDYSINPFTLSLDWSDAAMWENAPGSRRFLGVRKGEISLSLWRLLVLGEVCFDRFAIDGVDAALVRHPDNTITPLSRPGVSNVELRISIGTATNRFTRRDASKKNAEKAARSRGSSLQATAQTPVVIPALIINNINVTCDDGQTSNRLWSCEQGYIAVRNLRTPVMDNKEECRISLGTHCDGKTDSWFGIEARLRAFRYDPVLRISATVTNVRLSDQWFGKSSGHGAAFTSTNASSQRDAWFDTCFSNAFSNMIIGMQQASSNLAADAVVTNFFKTTHLTNMVLGLCANMGVSNRMLMPGFIDIRLRSLSTNIGPLHIFYAITNAAPWVTATRE